VCMSRSAEAAARDGATAAASMQRRSTHAAVHAGGRGSCPDVWAQDCAGPGTSSKTCIQAATSDSSTKARIPLAGRAPAVRPVSRPFENTIIVGIERML
jgi:hypothetical protein